MAEINILMCGGRRTGKTSVLAAIQENIIKLFPHGDIVLDMPNSSRLINYRTETTKIFGYDYEDESTFIANQGATADKTDYCCTVHLQRRASGMQLNFTDVPGEWFVNKEHLEALEEKMKKSQILIIAIDSPHMMEVKGRYHEVFNRATILTEQIRRTFQGNKEPRMVLFVPVKCEHYRAAQNHARSRMKDLMESVKSSYGELIDFLTAGQNRGIYTIAITPCFTVGGAEYLRFVPSLDGEGKPETGADGRPLQDIELDSHSGQMIMTYLTEYLLLMDEQGNHYYKPENCDQPLVYILLYLIAVSKCKVSGVFTNLWATFTGRPNRNILEDCKAILLPKVKHEEEDGFAILNDPLEMLQ